MPVTIGDGGLADFDKPIELMKDCHRRIERFLGVLLDVTEQADGRELSDEAESALRTALDYFDGAAPLHTADEERSLFPRMRSNGDARVAAAMSEIARLESDHRDAETAHAHVEELGRRWLEERLLAEPTRARLRQLLVDLQRRYREHIREEEQRIFPLAERVLDTSQLQAVGKEMKQRRIVRPGRADSRCAQRRRELFQQER